MGCLRDWLLPFALLVSMSTLPCLQAVRLNDKIKSQTFLSPIFSMTPGSVVEKFYYNIPFPRGHIALKSFDAEVVDESGNPISLFDTYLHHWAVVRYYQHKDALDPDTNIPYALLNQPDYIIDGNNGVCQNNMLVQFYGIGSETRKTSTFVPDPYGIELGSPSKVPSEYYERWVLNVHAIDTRGVENRLGCTECWCDLYNITKNRGGKPDYKGGLRCCYDNTQCKLVKQSYEEGERRRNLYMRYRVKWVDWDHDSVFPVKVYIFDATDSWKPLIDSKEPSQSHNCAVEYDVESCSPTNRNDDGCNAIKRTRVAIPSGGYLVYGVSHQHSGGIGSTLYGEDGRVLCNSSPIYGRGNEVGDEEGYIVGMTTCYPKPGSIKINDGEIMTFESNYASEQTHIGVMGLFQIMIADKLLPEPWLRMEPSKLVNETSI